MQWIQTSAGDMVNARHVLQIKTAGNKLGAVISLSLVAVPSGGRLVPSADMAGPSVNLAAHWVPCVVELGTYGSPSDAERARDALMEILGDGESRRGVIRWDDYSASAKPADLQRPR